MVKPRHLVLSDDGVDELDEPVRVVGGRVDGDFFAGDEGLEHSFCLAAQGPLLEVVDHSEVEINSWFFGGKELTLLSGRLSLSLDDEQRVIHHSQFR